MPVNDLSILISSEWAGEREFIIELIGYRVVGNRGLKNAGDNVDGIKLPFEPSFCMKARMSAREASSRFLNEQHRVERSVRQFHGQERIRMKQVIDEFRDGDLGRVEPDLKCSVEALPSPFHL